MHKISVITLLEYDCNVQPLTQLLTKNQRDSNAIITQCQRDTNATTLLYTDNNTIREQSTRASGFNEVKQLFNSICVSLPPLEFEPTAQQVRLIDQARINLRNSSFEEFFKRVEKSDFLCGRTGGNFKASFEWILKPENMMKICSGQYDHNYKQNAPQNVLATNPWENMTDEELAEQAKHFYD